MLVSLLVILLDQHCLELLGLALENWWRCQLLFLLGRGQCVLTMRMSYLKHLVAEPVLNLVKIVLYLVLPCLYLDNVELRCTSPLGRQILDVLNFRETHLV